MFEYHGWISVRESAGADDDDRGDEHLRDIAEGIRCRVRELGSPYLMDLRWMNGELFLHLGGFSNHRDEAVLGFFEEVGERAPGSYGLLHVRDDEDPGHENEIVVHRLVRGVAAVHVEPSLSPCVPVLEDPFGE
ncbi:Imm7 family immunity protein [Streptomyces sp. NPDC026673]|uniref:Imm7 family immunity protein n=1 Tax=Streptomyces sp. NPDC026673 TaxID=3155724 RepID=UPI0033EFB673